MAIEGIVEFQGRPLAKGSIRFLPIAPNRGPEAGAVIEQGRYEVAAAEGPPAGMLRVEIREAPHLPSDLTHDSGAQKYQGFRLPPNPVPAEYNDRSKLTVEAESGKANRFDFQLPQKP